MDTGHSLVTLFSLSVSIKDRSLHKSSRQVTDLLSRAHTWVWALGRLVALLSWIRLFPDQLSGFCFWWRRSLHRTKSGTQGRGLGVPVWTGPGHLGQESDGLVLLVPGVQAGRVFSGYLAGGIDS